MKNILGLFVMVSLVFTSCKKEEVPTETDATTETAVDTTAVAPQAPTQQTPQVAAGPNMNSIMYSQPSGSGSTANTTTTTAAATAPVVVGKGMNPSHGQPGHRCDIAVGAPLNSPPGKASLVQPSRPTTISSTNAAGTVTSNGATITTTSATPSVSPIVTAPGMNPPHGQEGHLCSVAVGAPLPKSE
ncbi:hypothetical protein [Flavobacterium sp.]|uniref:hypothetical protein n=1 Tax=Flavobacterium sp. TaxID=239 RepID=UPI0037502B19